MKGRRMKNSQSRPRILKSCQAVMLKSTPSLLQHAADVPGMCRGRKRPSVNQHLVPVDPKGSDLS